MFDLSRSRTAPVAMMIATKTDPTTRWARMRDLALSPIPGARCLQGSVRGTQRTKHEGLTTSRKQSFMACTSPRKIQNLNSFPQPIRGIPLNRVQGRAHKRWKKAKTNLFSLRIDHDWDILKSISSIQGHSSTPSFARWHYPEIQNPRHTGRHPPIQSPS